MLAEGHENPRRIAEDDRLRAVSGEAACKRGDRLQAAPITYLGLLPAMSVIDSIPC